MPHRHKGGRWPLKFTKVVLVLVLFGGAALTLSALAVFIVFARNLPDPSNLEDRTVTESTKIYDRTGQIILYDIHGEERRTIIPFNEIPGVVKDATIVAEDRDFYQHRGIDFKAIIRAFLSNLTSDSLQGGSTITQQFVKKSILSDERTLTRKIKEAILALELERRYSKDEILNFYLNQIPYGANAYGIEAAAQTFFSKKASDLTLSEAVLLASLPKATSYYSPYGEHKDQLIVRQHNILNKMAELNYISNAEAARAKKQTLNFSKIKSGIQAPHFVFYVKNLVEEKYGEEYVAKAGLKVITTLDWDLQNIAETAVAAGADRNDKVGAHNAALTALDPKTGQILVMVGSRDYFKDPLPAGCDPGVNCQFEGNVNVVTRLRQPGSAFKPFVYATAFKKGYTDKTILFDIPTQFDTGCNSLGQPQSVGTKCYSPRNFDFKFRGPVTARAALANSLNVPAVQMLYLAGVEDSINTAEDMGLSTLKDRSRFGLSLVLGGGEIKLLELASAFGVLATEGVRHAPVSILRIENGKGEVLEEFKDEPSQVLDSEISRLVTNILSDNNARIPIFGPRSPLFFEGRPVAAKTGTTNEFRDGWTLGYTPSLVAGVWVGNNDNTPIKQEPGVYVAAPIWRDFMTQAFEKLNLVPESFTPPQVKEVAKPILNGQHIINGEIHSTLYYINRNDPTGSPPANPYADPMFNNWESAVRAWFGPIVSAATSTPSGQ
ncbi:MAG: transglycosylase domain-containing protein [Parcubacteria group bacterium]|nr:transglycosylase domain-containing protein [Parcubacteria group bacterium]